jgi:hypothetical protein
MSRSWPAHVQTVFFLGLLVLYADHAHAQGGHSWFGGASLGILRQDVQSSSEVRSSGVSALGRVGRDLGARAALLGEIGWLSTTRNTDVVFPACDPSQGCFGGVFIGPTAVLTLGAGLRLTTAPSAVRGYVTAGPVLFWAAHREAGTRAVGIGGSAGGGLIVQAGARTALVAEATYRRFASTGSTARWLVPITIGVEVR